MHSSGRPFHWHSWGPRQLDVSLELLSSGETPKAVANAGISGNRVLSLGTGPSALARFDRDVPLVPGAGGAERHPPENEAMRQAVNEWIRTSGAFDAVIDFDAAIRDPARPERMLPACDSGDHLHPGDAGYRSMGDAIDLTLFRLTPY